MAQGAAGTGVVDRRSDALNSACGWHDSCLHPSERWRDAVDNNTIEVLAKRAGLAKALAEFPDDVAISAKQAADVAQKIKRPADPTAEPWPPMKAGTTL